MDSCDAVLTLVAVTDPLEADSETSITELKSRRRTARRVQPEHEASDAMEDFNSGLHGWLAFLPQTAAG